MAEKVQSFEEAFQEAVKDDAAPVAAVGTAAVEPKAGETAPAAAGTTNNDFEIPTDDAAAKAAAEKAAAEKATQEAAAKAEADKAAQEAATKAATEKAAQDAAAKAEADKVTAEKAAQEAAAKVAAEVAARAAETPEAKLTREAQEKAAAEKAAADKAAADKAALEKAAVDAVARAEAAKQTKAEAERIAADKEKERLAAEPKFDQPFAMSDADKASVAELDKEWPEVGKGVAVLLRKQAHEIEQRVAAALFNTVKSIGSLITPVMQSQNLTEEERHAKTIAEKHADYKDLLPEVEKWIPSQPAYLHARMNEVLDGGTAAEVIELYTTFKKATGRETAVVAAPVVAAPVVPAAGAAPPVMDAATKAAAEVLAPVRSRSAVPAAGAGQINKNDYAGAWTEAMAG